MLEAGIGRAHNIALATLPNFTLPGDVSASKRYWKRDMILPAVEVSDAGTIAVRGRAGVRIRTRSRLHPEHHGARGSYCVDGCCSCFARTAITAVCGRVKLSAKSAITSTTSRY